MDRCAACGTNIGDKPDELRFYWGPRYCADCEDRIPLTEFDMVEDWISLFWVFLAVGFVVIGVLVLFRA